MNDQLTDEEHELLNIIQEYEGDGTSFAVPGITAASAATYLGYQRGLDDDGQPIPDTTATEALLLSLAAKGKLIRVSAGQYPDDGIAELWATPRHAERLRNIAGTL